MNDALLPLAVCIIIGLLWYDAMTARELALAHARRLCSEHGAQMLDQGIALQRLRPMWRGGRPRLARGYRFELSYHGGDRHRGSLTLVGKRLADWSLPSGEQSPALTSTGNATPRLSGAGDNVVPIERARGTLH
ncbi:MAG: DUF3301 domain-containing protein [Rhodanobacteraceae bacterium]